MQYKFSKDGIYSVMPSMNESFKTDLTGHFTCQINRFSFCYLRPETPSIVLLYFCNASQIITEASPVHLIWEGSIILQVKRIIFLFGKTLSVSKFTLFFLFHCPLQDANIGVKIILSIYNLFSND